jgi:hypothetical protein
MPTSEIGKWDEPLFQSFRRAKGKKRRALLSELLKVNTPLIKLIVSQIAGVGDEKTAPGGRIRRSSRMRVPGADQVPWDDLMQAGLHGMAHALGKFDPTKGKISGYFRWWALTNIQRLVRKEAMIKTPDRQDAVSVALFDDADALDRIATDHDSGGLAEVEGLTPELVAQWGRTGDWPDSLEAWRASTRVYSVPRPPLDVFLERRCTRSYSARAPLWPLWNAWRVECGLAGRPSGTQPQWLAALATRHVRLTSLRVRLPGGSPSVPERGLAGLCAV